MTALLEDSLRIGTNKWGCLEHMNANGHVFGRKFYIFVYKI